MNVVCDLYKPCTAFEDLSLLIVLVSLYFLFSSLGSSDNTKEICFFKLLNYIKQCIFKVKSSIYIVLYLGRYMFIARRWFFVSTSPPFKLLPEVRLKRHLGPPTCAIWFGSAPFSIFVADQLLKAFSIVIADQLRAFHFVAWVAVILYSVSHGSINIVVISTKRLFTPVCYISWVLADDF